MARIAAALISLLLACSSAAALVGGAEPAGEEIARHVVLILGSQGTKRSACTGTALARNLVLTAAHCVLQGASNTVLTRGEGRDPKRMRVLQALPHPDFNDAGPVMPTADLALLKLAEPLSARMAPAPLGTRSVILIGERFIVAGYGVTSEEGQFGILRAATLMAVRNPTVQHFLLTDPATRGETTGLGVCSGDSGGPVFDHASGRLALVAVVSWASSSRHGPGCGGLTGATPVSPYRDWILDTARKLGGEMAP
jgi:hypothetical protein